MLFSSRYAVFLTATIVVAAVVPVHAFRSLGLQVTIVSESPATASIALVQNKLAISAESRYPGRHTLKIIMTVVVQKIIIHDFEPPHSTLF